MSANYGDMVEGGLSTKPIVSAGMNVNPFLLGQFSASNCGSLFTEITLRPYTPTLYYGGNLNLMKHER